MGTFTYTHWEKLAMALATLLIVAVLSSCIAIFVTRAKTPEEAVQSIEIGPNWYRQQHKMQTLGLGDGDG